MTALSFVRFDWIVAAVTCVLMCHESSMAQWEPVLIGVEASWNGIEFVDDSVGIAVGSDLIGRTTDAGLTWNLVDSTTFFDLDLEDIVCGTTSVGVVCVVVGTKLGIGRSVDRGLSWSLVNQEFDATLTGASVIDSLTIVAVGIGGWVVRSTDTGLTWNSHLIFPQADLYDVTLGPRGRLWAVGFQTQPPGNCCGVILVSDDVGDTWQVVHTMPRSTDGRVEDIHFVSDSVAVAITSGSVFSERSDVWRSQDGGTTWDRGGQFGRMYAIDFFEDQGLMAGAQGGVFWSEDEGATWVQQENPNIATYRDVALVDATTGLAVGGGVIIRNGAGATVAVEAPALLEESTSSEVYPNPTSTNATIVLKSSGQQQLPARIQVTDMLGRTVLEADPGYSAGRSEIRVPTASLPPGLYFYTIESGRKQVSGTFVVAR